MLCGSLYQAPSTLSSKSSNQLFVLVKIRDFPANNKAFESVRVLRHVGKHEQFMRMLVINFKMAADLLSPYLTNNALSYFTKLITQRQINAKSQLVTYIIQVNIKTKLRRR